MEVLAAVAVAAQSRVAVAMKVAMALTTAVAGAWHGKCVIVLAASVAVALADSMFWKNL